jgi:hypothetical protein
MPTILKQMKANMQPPPFDVAIDRYMQTHGKSSATMVIGMAIMSGLERALRDQHGYAQAQ